VGRGRKIGIALLVMLVLLLGLVIVADRVGAGVAEERIGQQAAEELRKAGATTASEPKVEIGGFPFLTQVLGGSYEKITISADKPQSNDIQLETMTIVASDVKAAASDLLNGRGPVTANRLTGTATMSWDTVRSLIQLANLPVPFDPATLQVKVVDNNVELRLPIALAGFETTLVAKGEINVAAGKVNIKLTDVSAEGTDIPAAAKRLLDQFKSRLTASIRTPQMPYTLTIRSIDTDDNGVRVVATAENVQLVS
jgi:LmeA-like phospholipid-binding